MNSTDLQKALDERDLDALATLLRALNAPA